MKSITDLNNTDYISNFTSRIYQWTYGDGWRGWECLQDQFDDNPKLISAT